MRKLTYFVGASLDGFIAGPTGDIDMYPTPPAYLEHLCAEYGDALPTGARQALGIADQPNKRFDTIIQGRATYDLALSAGITSPYAHLRQLVVSSTLAADTDPEVEIVSGDVVSRVRELKAEPGLGIYLAGGAQLAGSLIGEIDEVILKLYPIMLGTGIPTLDGEYDLTSFARTDVTTFDSGHVILAYSRE